MAEVFLIVSVFSLAGTPSSSVHEFKLIQLIARKKIEIERMEALISNFSGVFIEFLSLLAYNLGNFIYIFSDLTITI